MPEENKKELFRAVGVGFIIISVAVAYYLAYYLPKKDQEYLDFQKMQASQKLNENAASTAADLESKKRETAKAIQDDCLKKAQDVTLFFGIDTTYSQPLYFPYDDINSFNKNERLVTALTTYSTCIENDPRNDGSNDTLKKIDTDALDATTSINGFNWKEVTKNPDWCNSYLISEPAKNHYCNNSSTQWTGETYLSDGHIANSDNFPTFPNKQECLAWGVIQREQDKVDSFKCATGCGSITSGGHSYFLCDPASEIDVP